MDYASIETNLTFSLVVGQRLETSAKQHFQFHKLN